MKTARNIAIMIMTGIIAGFVHQVRAEENNSDFFIVREAYLTIGRNQDTLHENQLKTYMILEEYEEDSALGFFWYADSSRLWLAFKGYPAKEPAFRVNNMTPNAFFYDGKGICSFLDSSEALNTQVFFDNFPNSKQQWGRQYYSLIFSFGQTAHLQFVLYKEK